MSEPEKDHALSLFCEAIELEGSEREEFLVNACAGNSQLRRDVDDLLRMDESEEGVFGEAELEAHRAGLDQLASKDAAPMPVRSAAIPETISHYEIVRQIGAGGMGVVYEAKQSNPARRVAIKVLLPNAMSALHLQRFQLESEMLGRLTHPGIARIYEAGTFNHGQGDQPFFAMEFIEGVDLLAWSKAAGRTRDERLQVFVRVCKAVHHAHMKGVVHRDLKPDNVLITADNRPKILDFGVARAVDGDVQLTTMHTRAGELLGTVAYMSPEQARGEANEVMASSDTYTLGVLLYQLLTDRLPHDVSGRSIPDAVRRIWEDEPTSLAGVDRTLGGDLDTIVHRALEKEPDRRYSSAMELAQEIERFLSNDPILARPPSAIYYLRKFTRRHRGLTAGIALAFLAITIGLAFAIQFGLQEAEQRKKAERSDYRSTIAVAGEAFARNRPSEVQALLDRTAPDLRGWEYHYLQSALNSHLWEVPHSPWSLSSPGRTTLKFTPDSSRIVSFPDVNTIAIYESQTGVLVHSVHSETPWVQWTLAVSQESVLVATEAHRLVQIHVESGETLMEHTLDERVICQGFSADGSSAAVLTSSQPTNKLGDDYQVYLFVNGGLQRVERHPITNRIHTPENLVFANWRTRLALDADTGALIDLEVDNSNSYNYSSQTGKLIGGGTNRRLRLWELVEGKFEFDRSLVGHRQKIIPSTAISEDGSLAASLAEYGQLHLWDLETNQVLAAHEIRSSGACDLDSTGRLLAARDASRLRVWETAESARVLGDHETFVYEVEFSPDGKTLLSRDFDFTVKLWDVTSGSQIASVEQPLSPWRPRAIIGFTADASAVICASKHGGIHRMEIASELEFKPFPLGTLREGQIYATPFDWIRAAGAPESASHLLFSPDGTLTVASPFEEIIALETNEVRAKTWKSAHRSVARETNAAFSPDGKLLAIARGHSGEFNEGHFASKTQRGGVAIHSVNTGNVVGMLTGHVDAVYGVDWSPDGRRIATSSNDNKIRIWSADTFEPLLTLEGHDSYVHDVAWSPDGTQLASASGDGTVRLWDSVPVAERREQARTAARLRSEVRADVAALLNEHANASVVAEALRNDESLDEARRHASLRVLRELLMEAASPENH